MRFSALESIICEKVGADVDSSAWRRNRASPLLWSERGRSCGHAVFVQAVTSQSAKIVYDEIFCRIRASRR